MEYSLQAYFDTGASHGLGDEVFARSPHRANAPDILKIGIRNPLGLGLRHRLTESNPEVIAEWRRCAAQKVDDPEMDLGLDDSLRHEAGRAAEFEALKRELRDLIATHPIAFCDLTIYALGVAFIRLDFAKGIPVHLLRGIGHCFEFAAYLVPVSRAILKVAKAAVDAALEQRPRTWRKRRPDAGIQSLSKRPAPEIETDERDYSESRLFTAFTHVALCIDRDDDVEDIKRRIQPLKPGTSEPDSRPLVFEYHGTIHFNWAACVLEPKSLADPHETPRDQIARMLLCIQIAHTFQGACEAFERLFLQETMHQAEGYIKGEPGGRDHVELNKLRTLALAVVSLTNFAPVAAAEEDQAYFRAYNEYARLEDTHALILTRCEILLNVQQAAAAEEESRRQLYLNTVVLTLTGFTLLSVLADTYGFLRGEEKWLSYPDRAGILLMVLLLLVVTLFSLRRLLRRRIGRRGSVGSKAS